MGRPAGVTTRVVEALVEARCQIDKVEEEMELAHRVWKLRLEAAKRPLRDAAGWVEAQEGKR